MYGLKLGVLVSLWFDAETWEDTHSPGDRLLGFQDGWEQRVTLTREEFVENPQAALGKSPVLVGADGQMFGYTLGVSQVWELEK